MSDHPGILVAGETLLDFVPETSGPPGAAGGYEPAFGGAGANVARAMSHLQCPPLFWTRLAEDDLGQFLRADLVETGVRDRFLVADPEARTSLALVTHDETGDRSFTFYREDGADTRLAPGTVGDQTLAECSLVHTSGFPMSTEPTRSAILDLQARASDHATVTFDPNWRPALWPSHHTYRAVVRGAFDDVDVVVASREDLAAAGFDTAEPGALARAVTEHGPHTAVVTLGGEGAVCYGTPASPVPDHATHDGYDVDAVDTTGAGDAFLAAFVLALEHGVSDGERALAVGNAAGAVTTTRAGAVTALAGDVDLPAELDDWPW